MFFRVPPCSLKEDTVNVAAVFRFFFDFCVSHLIHNFYLKIDSIDGNYILSGVVLKGSSDEGLREEETRDPEDIRCASIDPLLQELYPISEILSPRPQRFHGKETDISPKFGHLLIK